MTAADPHDQQSWLRPMAMLVSNRISCFEVSIAVQRRPRSTDRSYSRRSFFAV